jgi:uncharacterized Zn finger protein
MRLTLYALSSDTITRYSVDFAYEAGVLSVRCGCQAGLFAKYCKHVQAFLLGDASMLADSQQTRELKRLASVVSECGVASRIAAILDADLEIKRAQKRLKTLKDQLCNDLLKTYEPA